MTEQIQYPKIDLIERDAEIDLMREMSRSVIETGERRVLYFEAGGGLGKTRLLQDYPKIVAQDASRMLVADVIDMYDFENWRPIEIERKIVNSLRLAARSRIAKNDIDAIFLEYKKAYSYYHAIQGVLHVATMQAEGSVILMCLISFQVGSRGDCCLAECMPGLPRVRRMASVVGKHDGNPVTRFFRSKYIHEFTRSVMKVCTQTGLDRNRKSGSNTLIDIGLATSPLPESDLSQ